MSETGTTTPAQPSYGIYWRAWLALLGITILMLVWTHTPVLIAGMCIKAGVITLIFMHLKHERLDFTLYVLLGIFLTALVLFFLIMPDGMAA